ncbi:MAG: transposase [Anaerolineaceae bacterium]
MRIHVAKPLFAWDCLEDSPSLKTIRDFLASVPDAKLLDGLRTWRGKGRDDYPVSILWGTLLLTIGLRHTTIEGCLAELRRNEGLRQLVGIESEDHVPKKWNMSRFLSLLGQEPHLSAMRAIFDQMLQRLGQVVADLGKNTAGDSTGLSARRSEAVKEEIASRGEDAVTDENGLPLPSGGRKEYRDDSGKVTKILEWFGYKGHLLVDVKHEVILAYHVTSTKTSDNDMIEPLIEQAKRNLPEDRIRTMAYDKAADDAAIHELLDDHGIKPVIQIRSCWQNQTEKLVPGQERRGNIVHDEAGTVFCYDTKSQPPVRHKMAYTGHEPERSTLKYRCPAKHEGWSCPMSEICNADKTYGLTVRVKQETDLRRFPPIPRATKKFEQLYNGRTSVERVNSRLKVFWGTDDGNITGAARFHAYFGAVMVVHAAFATLLAAAPRFGGVLGQTRLSTISRALQKELTR